MDVKTTPISDIREIEDRATNSRWIFRGQRDIDSPLITSLERTCKAFEVDISKHGEKVEAILLREFRRRLHHYSSHVPKDDAYLEWLAYMQHFGAPTRLLDGAY